MLSKGVLGLKQKKKNRTVNNKFNFDDEYIIGFSDSNPKSSRKKIKSSSKRTNKNVKKVVKSSNKKNSERPRMNEKKRKTKARIIKVFVIICLLVGAGCFLCLSPMFNVQEIMVEQNSIIASETIDSLSGIQMYKNIFLIKKSDAIENIKRNPYINDVKISRVLPNKMKIIVSERTEKYLVEFAEGKYAIIDGQGYVLSVTSELKQLPVITGVETGMDNFLNISNNQVRLCENDLKKLDTVANIVETAKNYEVDTYITEIDISDDDDYKLILGNEQKNVYLGSCSDLNTRILYMKEILNNEKGKKGELFINSNLSEHPPYFREAVN